MNLKVRIYESLPTEYRLIRSPYKAGQGTDFQCQNSSNEAEARNERTNAEEECRRKIETDRKEEANISAFDDYRPSIVDHNSTYHLIFDAQNHRNNRGQCHN
ncbi:hypothetical protein ACLOJK_012316 [Asimina triloba]